MTTAISSVAQTPQLSQHVVDDSRDVLSRHARSFRWAAALLPAGRHDDAAVAYAFCRHVDDTADEASSQREAMVGLERIDAELHGRCAPGALTAAYLQMCRRCSVPTEAAEQLIEGARSDLTAVRVADDAELLQYCYRVAGTVGVMMCGVLGVRDSRALAHAVDLGIAMQLTNICRDVLEDAQRGRVYLPEVRLRAAGSSAEQLLAGSAPESAVVEVVNQLLIMADRYYASADGGMRFIPLRARFAIVAASRIYRAIGVRLRTWRGCNPLLGRVVVPWTAKILWLLVAMVSTIGISLRRRQRPHDRQLHKSLVGLLPAAEHVKEQ